MSGLTAETQPGFEIRGREYRVSPARMRAFSGGPFDNDAWPLINIHTDTAHALSCGLKKRNASGTQWQGYILQMMIELFGTGWLSHGKIETKFIRLVNEDDVVRPWVRVTARERTEGGIRFAFDIGCDNQRGETVLAGTAGGILPQA